MGAWIVGGLWCSFAVDSVHSKDCSTASSGTAPVEELLRHRATSKTKG